MKSLLRNLSVSFLDGRLVGFLPDFFRIKSVLITRDIEAVEEGTHLYHVARSGITKHAIMVDKEARKVTTISLEGAFDPANNYIDFDAWATDDWADLRLFEYQHSWGRQETCRIARGLTQWDPSEGNEALWRSGTFAFFCCTGLYVGPAALEQLIWNCGGEQAAPWHCQM